MNLTDQIAARQRARDARDAFANIKSPTAEDRRKLTEEILTSLADVQDLRDQQK